MIVANKEQMVLDRLHIIRKAAREINLLAPCGVNCEQCPAEIACPECPCAEIVTIAEMGLPGDE